MPEITYIDPDDAAREHPEVVAYIATYHRLEEPDSNIKVYAHRKFNMAEPLEWSMIITSTRGRKHISVDQRHANGAIKFSFD